MTITVTVTAIIVSNTTLLACIIAHNVGLVFTPIVVRILVLTVTLTLTHTLSLTLMGILTCLILLLCRSLISTASANASIGV